MPPPKEVPVPHPEGERETPASSPLSATSVEPAELVIVDTPGGRFRAQFSSDLPISSSGTLVFFTQFLATTGAFEAFVADAPLSYASKRAHSPRDILGTLVLGMICEHFHYAHLSALRGNELSASLLGLKHIVSEDCVRRALRRIEL